jgi:hypothetical protein
VAFADAARALASLSSAAASSFGVCLPDRTADRFFSADWTAAAFVRWSASALLSRSHALFSRSTEDVYRSMPPPTPSVDAASAGEYVKPPPA